MAKHPEGYSECTDDGVGDLAEFRCLTHGTAGESMSHRSGYFPLSILESADGVLDLAFDLVGLAFRLQLGVPTALPTICLTAPLTSFADPAMLVHDSLSNVWESPQREGAVRLSASSSRLLRDDLFKIAHGASSGLTPVTRLRRFPFREEG